MFTKFKRERAILFLDPNAIEEQFSLDKKERVDIVLSPALYWVKKVKLPIKSLREVKKLLPSIFEDTLLEGHYSYAAYRSGEEYFIFAYEDKKIFDLLAKKGIAFANVASVRFAQSEFVGIEESLSINEKQCMQIKDELLVLVPSSWVGQKNQLDMSGVKLSNHTVKLEQFGHIVDKSTLYKIGAALLFLALIFGVEIFIANAKKTEIESAREELFSKYNLQPTLFQNRSLLERYSKIDSQQAHLREYISYFLTMKLQNSQKIELLELKNGVLFVSISGVEASNAKSITKILDEKKIKYTQSISGTTLKLEMKL